MKERAELFAVPSTQAMGASFEDFFEREKADLYGAMCLVTRDRHEAEEIVQDAFVRVLERWDRVGSLEDPHGYLYRTAMNVFRSRYNNVLPDPETGIGCSGDLGEGMEGIIAWTFTTKPACLREQIDTYAKKYDAIFTTIAALRGESPTVLAALNVHDGNIGSAEWRDADVSPATIETVEQWIIDSYDRWNPMLCGQAARHGFTCVDVYEAFNGPDGSRPTGKLTIDGAHPSQAGNDLIAELLGEIDVNAITDAGTR
jgi:hypothetical protein